VIRTPYDPGAHFAPTAAQLHQNNISAHRALVYVDDASLQQSHRDTPVARRGRKVRKDITA
jgi:hypothetical protein